jgi:hypothetical protein
MAVKENPYLPLQIRTMRMLLAAMPSRTRPWFEFEALVIKLSCNVIGWIHLEWKDIHDLMQGRPIRVITSFIQ